MRSLASLLLLAVATLVVVSPLAAQQKRISPHETISLSVDKNRVTIIYGRPYSKDPKSGEIRAIWGKLVPYGQVWRTGSDEATSLITEKTIVLGGTTVPAGAYTLYTLPAADGSAKLIVNRELGQWGTQYDDKQDLARIDLTKAATPAQVDEFTISLKKGPSGSGVITLMWENTQYSVSYIVAK
jgi:hypothetical protein